jgi:hypothetical protein
MCTGLPRVIQSFPLHHRLNDPTNSTGASFTAGQINFTAPHSKFKMGQSITSKLNSITRIKENENNLLLWKQYNVDFVLQVPKKTPPKQLHVALQLKTVETNITGRVLEHSYGSNPK